jgi:hypothetical protein
MFSNWRVYDVDSKLVGENMSESEAEACVDTWPHASYALDPNGNTYPPDLHDDGAYDPAFN